MRHRSLTGPVVLICVGAYFLARNAFPELHLMRWLFDYWPVLLIAIGAAKLLERVSAPRAPGDTPMGGYWR